MAVFLPAILDMVDELYINLDDQSMKMGEGGFPFMFVPPQQQSGGCRRGFNFNGHGFRQTPGGGCRRGQRLGCSRNGACAKTDDFQVSLDVKQFKPEDITVKTKNSSVIIEAKHDERSEDNGFATRHITRRYELPSEYDPNTVTSHLSNAGVMVIRASKPKPTASGERVIEIQRVEAEEPKKPEAEEPKKHEAEETKEADWEKVPVEKVEESKKDDTAN